MAPQLPENAGYTEHSKSNESRDTIATITPVMKCKPIELSQLQPGAVLVAPIVDPIDTRLRLLAAGTEITEVFLDRLKARGVHTVMLSQRDIAMLAAFTNQGRRTKVPPPPNYVKSSLENDGSKEVDSFVGDGEISNESLDTDYPIAHEMKRSVGQAYPDGLKQQWAKESAQRIVTVHDFIEESVSSTDSSVGPLYGICNDLIDRLVEDPDALVALASSPYPSDYPSRHGVHLASLAIAIAADQGLDRSQLVDLGVGCLIHDVGMRAVGVGIFDTDKPLSPGAIHRLADHPVKAIEIATQYGESLSLASRIVLYQIHERCDGSGYPRGIAGDQIHPLAKIAGVADSFIGMVSRRKHRLAILGYHANLAMLAEAKNNRFDPSVIRSLVRTTSLHPIGSFVQLDNQYIGRVLRSGGDDFVRPTIEMWHPDRRDAKPIVVNLAEEESLRIVAAIPAAA